MEFVHGCNEIETGHATRTALVRPPFLSSNGVFYKAFQMILSDLF